MSQQPRPSRDVATRVATGVLAGVAATLPFLVLLLVAVTKNPTVRRIDQRFADDLNAWALERPGLVGVLEVVGDATAPVVFHLVVLAVAVALWRVGMRRRAVWAVTTMATGAVLNVLLKLAVSRTRPVFEDPVAVADHHSFPSGHALNSALGVAIVLVALGPWLHGRRRISAWILGASVILVVGFDRVGLGVHFISDVVAGWFEAAAVLTTMTLVFGLHRRRGTLAEQVREIGHD